MEGARDPFDRIEKVERSFEWSRLESQLMTRAYERVLPVVRSVRDGPLLVGPKLDLNELSRSNGGEPRYATGA